MEKIYETLLKEAKSRTFKLSRYELISYCIGYYKVVNENHWMAINQLYNEGVIER